MLLNQVTPKSPIESQITNNEMFDKIKSLLQRNKLAHDDSYAFHEAMNTRVS